MWGRCQGPKPTRAGGKHVRELRSKQAGTWALGRLRSRCPALLGALPGDTMDMQEMQSRSRGAREGRYPTGPQQSRVIILSEVLDPRSLPCEQISVPRHSPPPSEKCVYVCAGVCPRVRHVHPPLGWQLPITFAEQTAETPWPGPMAPGLLNEGLQTPA